jgi:hypothetical protein
LKVPLAHGVHTRSDDTPAAALSYSPALHVVTAWHTRSDVPVGAANVNWPLGHDARCVLQSRSAEAVGATFSYSPDVHSVTATHAPPSLAPEYVPDAHGAHWRSASAEPALDMPWPIGHVDQAAHELWSAEAANVSGVQSVHTRSALAVAGVWMKVPAWQLAVASTQKPLSEKVLPATHVAHWRSAAVDPATA